MSTPDTILQFWFRDLTDATVIDKKAVPAKFWFNGGKAFDEEIRKKFLKIYEEAKLGECKDWEATPRGRLALVILCDQFPRNMFRNSPQAFETDKLALDVALRSINDGSDRELALIERVFLYMPLMHAESVDIQRQGVWSFEAIVAQSRNKASHNTQYFEYNLSFARRHQIVIAQFRRFPRRNAVLKRASTADEAAFHANPGSSF